VIEYVDVFTDTVGLGNRTGVVLDATGMDAAEMQAIAAGAAAVETAFGVASRTADLGVRYFSRTCELPLCGHGTVGFHYLRARRLDLPAQVLHVETGAGILPIEIERTADDHRVVMTLGAPRIISTVADVGAVCLALGLAPSELVAALPVQVVTTGHPKILVPLRRHAALAALRPDRAALIALGTTLGAPGFFPFTLDRQRADVLYHGRMFAPGTGVDEDAVTGNAHGPTGHYLATHGLFSGARYLAAQGDELGKPGLIEVRLSPGRIQITGRAVIA
jgi:PhzF family phenazine biosynthesis protein